VSTVSIAPLRKTVIDYIHLVEFTFTVKFINYDPKNFHNLTFRLSSEVFVRRMKTSLLHLVLGTVSSRCAKKTVVRKNSTSHEL